ncbi:MAG: hypothetical protein M1834_005949 [Cirrosporium novae-zelandiae]|nr:MAG: hypothetical protein M1834_005949 [Cirrosporium novae-zelandiae]
MDGIDPRLRSTSTTNSALPGSSYGQPAPPPPYDPHIRLPLPQLHGPSQSDLPSLAPNPHQHPYYALPQNSAPEERGDPHYAEIPTTHQEPVPNPILTHPEDSSGDLKRPRACEACRGLKVRCEPDPNSTDGTCKRCRKGNRQCVVTVPSRKRQKKTDSRVAELEKKIEALTASIKHAGGRPALESIANGILSANDPQSPYTPQSVGYQDQRMESSGSMGMGPETSPNQFITPSVAGQKRRHSNDNLDQTGRDSMDAVIHPDLAPQAQNATKVVNLFDLPKSTREPSRTMDSATPSGFNAANEYTDILDRGVIDTKTASQIFDRFVNEMAPLMPVVAFPPGTTATDVSSSKPLLFVSILAAASSLISQELQRTLVEEITRAYARRIICNGEKSIEIIQALLVSTVWYWPPDRYEELKFYQFIHIAGAMAIDLGISRKGGSKIKAHLNIWKELSKKPDGEPIEAKRTWLACYFLAACSAMSLRRPNLIRWTSYMAECVETLENSPDAYPSDKLLTRWVKLQCIADDVGVHFSMDDPSASVGISDPKVPFALKNFEAQLAKWRQDHVPSSKPDSDNSVLNLGYHVVNLYMHEVAMHVNHNVEDFKPPYPIFENQTAFHEAAPQTDRLSSAHLDALTICLTTMHDMFDTFLSLPMQIVRSIPTIHFVRVAYAIVLLNKLYIAVTTPKYEVGKVIGKDDLKMEQYMDKLMDFFAKAAEEGKCRPAAKFSMVLKMLKAWFDKQKTGRPGGQLPTSGPSKDGNIVTQLVTAAGSPQNKPDATPGASSTTATISSNGVSTPIAPELFRTPGGMKSPDQSKGSNSNGPNRSTPLHLLSEVATGNGRSSQQQQQQQQQSPQNQNQPQTPNPVATAPMTPSNTTAPQNWPNFYTGVPTTNTSSYPMTGGQPSYTEFPMGDEQEIAFEQALGLTLDEGGLSSFFMDDAVMELMDSSMGAGLWGSQGSDIGSLGGIGMGGVQSGA